MFDQCAESSARKTELLTRHPWNAVQMSIDGAAFQRRLVTRREILVRAVWREGTDERVLVMAHDALSCAR